MLPHSGSSSIQKRRQHHRRQQSLEVPILATPLPPNPRRTYPGHRPSHRRGLSLDQSLSNMQTPTGTRLLIPQAHPDGLPPGPPSARTPHPDTNLAYPPDQQQHLFKQETQEHSLAQPGFQHAMPPQIQAQAPNFQSHLQQQLNGIFNPSLSTPNPNQAVAMQNLQHHMMWYEQNFGNGVTNPNMQNAPCVPIDHSVAGDMAAPAFLSHPQTPALPPTPTPRGHSQTVPNTPQNNAPNWPSPPPSHAKHQRSHSYQLDVAPMPPPKPEGGRYPSQRASFTNDSFSMASEQDYAASAYSSSIADPSSPSHQHGEPMPTLFEDVPMQYRDGGMVGDEADILLQAAAGAEQDFNSPGFIIGNGGMCPEQAALDAAGIDATYIDTGISEDQINSWLEHPVNKGDAYRCNWEGCNAKINRKENARSHVQNHLDDRRFRCNPCGKRFNRLHDTKRHHLTHTNERPAVCPCGKTFARADALTRHRQRDMCEGVLPGFEKKEDEKPKRGRPKKDRSGEIGEKLKKTNRPDMEARTRKAALARAMDAANERDRMTGGASTSSAASDCSMPDTPPQDDDEMTASDFLHMGDRDGDFKRGNDSWLDTPPTSPPSATPSKTSSAKLFIDFSIPEEMPESVSPSKLSTRSSPTPQPRGGKVDDVNALFADYSSPTTYGGVTGFTGDSSPIGADVDIFQDAVNFDALDAHPDVVQNGFSPPGESCSGSSVYNSDWEIPRVKPPVKKERMQMTATASANKYDDFESVSRGSFTLDDFIGASEEDQYSQVRDILDSWVASH